MPAAEAVHVGFAALAPHWPMAPVAAAATVAAAKVAAVVRKVNDSGHRELPLRHVIKNSGANKHTRQEIVSKSKLC